MIVFQRSLVLAFALAPLLICQCFALTGAPPSGGKQTVNCGGRTFDIYFDEWAAELTPDARESIALVQHDLSACEIQRVRIVGLAGARGDEAANLDISSARAEAIAAALAEGGWPANRFEVTALGEAGATAGDVTRPMRRRVHVIVDAAPRAN